MTQFAPQLFMQNGITDISFYSKAFGAVERLRFNNDDGSLHVAELAIGEAIFHLHEITDKKQFISPRSYNATTVLVGLFVQDVDAVMLQAVNAGATEMSPAKDYEYGYRQGEIRDPFGHYWLIQAHVQ